MGAKRTILDSIVKEVLSDQMIFEMRSELQGENYPKTGGTGLLDRLNGTIHRPQGQNRRKVTMARTQCWTKGENISSSSQRRQLGLSMSMQEVWVSCWVLGKAVSCICMLSSTPSQPHKNGPWTCSPALPRAKKSSQPHSSRWVYDLTWEYLSLFQTQSCTALFCLGVIWYPVSPTTISVTCRGRTGSFRCSTRRVHAGQLPCVGC